MIKCVYNYSRSRSYMEDKEKNDLTEDQAEDEGRPPVDPNNKLYTFLSLLIFAVVYIGWQLVKDEFSMVYVLHNSAPSDGCTQIVLREIGMDVFPEDMKVDYFRVSRGFDDNALYISLVLPEEYDDSEDAESIIPYEYGNIVHDERFTIYDEESMDADFVYGDSYVCVEDPKKSVLIYEENDRLVALFRTVDYSSEIVPAMKEGTKINVDNRGVRQ